MRFLPLFLLIPFFLSAPAAKLPAHEAADDEEYFFFEDEGVTVVGTVQTSQQIKTVDREQIENSGAGDLVNLLHETLGLNIVRYGAYGNQAGVNLRGFDSKRIAFLIDGAPAASSMDGKFDISQIDINSIERIEVIYGGADSKYNVSGAFGGVINIITIRRQEQGLRLSASVSNTSTMPGEYRGRNGETQNPHWEDLFDTQNYSLSAAFSGGLFSLSSGIFYNRAQNHFIFTDRYNYSRRKDNNEVWDAGSFSSFIWELPGLTRLIASAHFYYGDKNFPTSGFSSNFGNQIDFSSRQSLMIDMPRAFHDDLSTEFSVVWQFSRLEYTSHSDEVSLHDQNNFSAVNRWNWFAADMLVLRSGVDYQAAYLDSTEIGERIRHNGGFYIAAEYKPARSFMIIPSAKVIFSGEGFFAAKAGAAIIPKLGFLWDVTDYFSIKNNYFRNFKFPDFEELYWSGGGGFGNPNLRPEDGWGADLGFSWRITNILQFESFFFSQWIKDSIHWFSGSTGVWRPENVGEAVLFGLDNKINLGIPVSTGPVRRINASLSYLYQSSYLLGRGYSFESKKRIPYNPEHTAGGSIEIFWESGSASAGLHYESSRFHDTANLTVLEEVFLLNAGFNQKIGENLAVFGSLRNILNSSYESFYDYPMPGITLTLGMRIKFQFN